MWRPGRLVERNALVARRSPALFLAGFAEPVLLLLSIGFGVGGLVEELEHRGSTVPYAEFVAPGLLVVAAMTATAMDVSFTFFIKLKYLKTYDAVMATPLGGRDVAVGELTWSLLRIAVYSTAFLLTMVAFGLVHSWWALGALPVALAVSFAFGGAGLAATTYMRSWVDFDKVWLVLIPQFLFSGVFFPLDRYPGWAATIVRCLPLHQGVEAARQLVLGQPTWAILGHVAYLAIMGAVGLRIASRRIDRLLAP